MQRVNPTPPATILIVDDTPLNLALLGELLQPLYRVRSVNSGAHALRAVLTDPRPDLVLMDVMMPEMDGHEVLRRLRADPRTADLPVIFITAMSATEDEQQGLALGAVDYITKPFNPAVVQARVKTHLELKCARDRLASENDRLDAEVARRMRENLLIQDLSLMSLAMLAETRDLETGHHIMRTRAYVELLANHLADHPRFRSALAGERLDMVVRAAPLHDIGKVGIPDSILLKPGKLTAEEFEVMKRHAEIGAMSIGKAMSAALCEADDEVAEEVSGAFAFMTVAQEIAGSHHERWDGTGYPAGLAGDAIPVSGRLMALADVFDALMCRRVYKAPVTLDGATEIIMDGRGRHFDPDVVDAFTTLLDRFASVSGVFSDPSEPATIGS